VGPTVSTPKHFSMRNANNVLPYFRKVTLFSYNVCRQEANSGGHSVVVVEESAPQKWAKTLNTTMCVVILSKTIMGAGVTRKARCSFVHASVNCGGGLTV
jgi:hypothetical protein